MLEPCLLLQNVPSPKPQATWGRIGWCQALKVKLFFMARLKIVLPELRQTPAGRLHLIF